MRLLLQALAGGELVAAEEFGGLHHSFAGGLEGEDFEGAGAGGDEESLVAGVEDGAGVNFGVRGGIDYGGAVKDQTQRLPCPTLPSGVSAGPGVEGSDLVFDCLGGAGPVDGAVFFF